MSKIEWTEKTWNPVTGCDKVSQGCKNCYAEVMHRRLRGMGQPKYQHDFLGDVRCHKSELEEPGKWKKPRMVFVNSMADLFHKDVPFEFILKVYEVMIEHDAHIYQILTKRPERAVDFYRWFLDQHAPRRLWDKISGEPYRNIWIGTSVENQEAANERIPHLLEIPAAVRFLSCEPLLGPVEYDLTGIDWVIAGGESGHNARPMLTSWARSLRDQCQAAGIPFFFKQWGEWVEFEQMSKELQIKVASGLNSKPKNFEDDAGWVHTLHRVGKSKSGNSLDGQTWQQYPVIE